MRRRRRTVPGVLRLMAGISAFFVLAYYVLQRSGPAEFKRRKILSSFTRPSIVFNERVYIKGGESQIDFTDPYARHAFNVITSNAIGSDRNITDTRHPGCGSETFDVDYDLDFPTVSIIIAFHNEARSALLRTVTSVLVRTPPELVQEIILVDDFSDTASDGELLKNLPKVRLLRSESRQGLIRGRVQGADAAVAEYLVFLDSHCEVNVDWLQPLLKVVLENPRTVASPIIDVIDVDNFEYRGSSSELKGGFDWSLHFKWIPLDGEEKRQRGDTTQPFKSPTIAGGLFIIRKEWFETLGKHDIGLEIWGGESVEISLKTWMCGGSLQVVPCSRVGHVFRKKHPYTFPGGNANTYLRNSKRIAEVWLDEYKRFFYDARPDAKNKIIDSIQEQRDLRQKLECKSFKWYLDHVFPELQLPNGDDVAFGQLKQGDACLEAVSGTIKFAPCLPTKSQEWAYSNRGEIRSGNSCLTANLTPPRPAVVVIANCTSNNNWQRKNQQKQKWGRRARQLIHKASNFCMDRHDHLGLTLSECRPNAYSQFWDFTVELQTYFDTSAMS